MEVHTLHFTIGLANQCLQIGLRHGGLFRPLSPPILSSNRLPSLLDVRVPLALWFGADHDNLCRGVEHAPNCFRLRPTLCLFLVCCALINHCELSLSIARSMAHPLLPSPPPSLLLKFTLLPLYSPPAPVILLPPAML